MRRLPLPLVLLAAVTVTVTVAADTPQGDDDRLQGTWTIVHLNRPRSKGGRETFDFDDDKFRLVFEHGKVTSTGDGRTLWQGNYRLVQDQSPPRIEIVRASGPFKQGIYQLKGETLKVCLDYPANPRPTKFNPDRESLAELMIFKRQPADH